MIPDTLSLQGKVAIVTGSGRENGIGAGIALALARNGASVVVNYVSDSVNDRAAQVAETLREAGGQAIVVQAGVDTLEGARHLVKQTLEGFKVDHIDILGKMRPPKWAATYICSLRAVLTPDSYSEQRRHRMFLSHHSGAETRRAGQDLPD